MRNVLLLVVFMGAILPAPRSFASTNIFTDADADALLKLENAGMALLGDITDSARTVYQPNDFAEKQVNCLLELERSVEDIMRELDDARDGAVRLCVGIDFRAISGVTKLPDHATRSIT